MVGSVTLGMVVALSLFEQQSTNLVLAAAVVVGGAFAWRNRRGDFYKSVAEEKTAESERLHSENVKLRQATDITPIVDKLQQVTEALERAMAASDAVVTKVSEMNGSLRAHSAAMEALADRLILDEAARGLLATAAADKDHPRRRDP